MFTPEYLSCIGARSDFGCRCNFVNAIFFFHDDNVDLSWAYARFGKLRLFAECVIFATELPQCALL
jgi:hypothetical protein